MKIYLFENVKKDPRGKNQRDGDRDMKIEYFFYSNHFGNRKVKARLAAIFLILSVFFSPGVSLSSGGTPPQSITILYSNNINGEIDPCPS